MNNFWKGFEKIALKTRDGDRENYAKHFAEFKPFNKSKTMATIGAAGGGLGALTVKALSRKSHYGKKMIGGAALGALAGAGLGHKLVGVQKQTTKNAKKALGIKDTKKRSQALKDFYGDQ